MKKVLAVIISAAFIFTLALTGYSDVKQSPTAKASVSVEKKTTDNANAEKKVDENAKEKTKNSNKKYGVVARDVKEVKTKVKLHEGNRKIIIDTDTAGDDAVAMLIAAEDSGIDILGITVAAGNVSIEQAVDNALMTMEVANRKDIPVYAGAVEPLSGRVRETYSVFGTDGMGDQDLIHPSGKAEKDDAVDFIVSMAKQYPDELEIITLAPVTNIATAILTDPEAMSHVKRIWTMGTSGFGPGNATPVAEFNCYKDAEAYSLMLETKIPTTIIGLDMLTEDTYLEDETLKAMSERGKANQFISQACDFLADVKLETLGRRFADVPDAVAMACALWPEFTLGQVKVAPRCVTDDTPFYGQVIFYKENTFYDSVPSELEYDTEVVTEVAHDSFVEKTLKVLDNCTKREALFSVENLTCLTDLHLHLDGAISLESAKELAKLTGKSIPKSDEEILKQFQVPKDCHNLNEFLEMFEFPCDLLSTSQAVKQAVATLLEEEEKQGVMYCEIRFAPQKVGTDQEAAVLAAIEAINEAKIPANLILCCMRSDSDHMIDYKTVQIAKKYLGKGVAAIDLAGAEGLYPTKDFADIFALANVFDIPITIHAGEADGAESVKSAIDFGAIRIGHGVRALEEKMVVKELVDKGIALELCPTSNLRTGIFRTYDEYPLLQLMNAGVKVTINTDDPAIEDTTIKEEYQHMIDAFYLSKDDVKQLIMNSIDVSYATEDVKDKLREQVEKEFK